MERTEPDLASIEVIPRLPHHFGPDRGGDLPPGLLGAKIVKFGTVEEDIARNILPGLEGGGLIVHYLPAGETEVKMVAFSMCEEGMWIEYPEALNGRAGRPLEESPDEDADFERSGR